MKFLSSLKFLKATLTFSWKSFHWRHNFSDIVSDQQQTSGLGWIVDNCEIRPINIFINSEFRVGENTTNSLIPGEKENIIQKEVSLSKRGKVKVISVRTRRSFLLLSGWQCDQWRRGDRSVSPNIDTHQRSNNRLSFLNGSLIQHFIL